MIFANELNTITTFISNVADYMWYGSGLEEIELTKKRRLISN